MSSLDLDIVYPSSILRESLRNRDSPSSEPRTPPKKVQFNETSLSPSRPVSSSALSTSTPSPQRKKKKFFYDRDSLKSRYKKGAPGSRRHQRWSNEMYLNYDWSDLSESEPEEVDVFMVNEETLARPNFSFVEAYEQDSSEMLEDFWYGKAASLDSVHCLPPPQSRTSRPSAEPQDRFLRIPKRTRKQITKMFDSIFLEELERDFIGYLSFLLNNHWIPRSTMDLDDDDIDSEDESMGNPTDTPPHPVIKLRGGGEKFISTSETFECVEKQGKLVLFLRDSHARLIAHGVCRYYGLKSESWDDVERGRRGTMVYLAPSCLEVPGVPRLTLKELILEDC